MAPTTTRPSNQPRTNTGPRERALEDVRRTTTAMIGTGLNATPIASGREWPIASPMRSPSNRLQRSAHHDLDVTVVARVVLGGDVAAPGIVLPGLAAVATSDAPANLQSSARAVAAMRLRDRLGQAGLEICPVGGPAPGRRGQPSARRPYRPGSGRCGPGGRRPAGWWGPAP